MLAFDATSLTRPTDGQKNSHRKTCAWPGVLNGSTFPPIALLQLRCWLKVWNKTSRKFHPSWCYNETLIVYCWAFLRSCLLISNLHSTTVHLNIAFLLRFSLLWCRAGQYLSIIYHIDTVINDYTFPRYSRYGDVLLFDIFNYYTLNGTEHRTPLIWSKKNKIKINVFLSLPELKKRIVKLSWTVLCLFYLFCRQFVSYNIHHATHHVS